MTTGKEDPGTEHTPTNQSAEHYEDMDDYDLCALYCDYHEWLVSEMWSPTDPAVRDKYRGKLQDIVLELARRYKDEV